MSRIRAKNTKPELLLRKALRKIGITKYKLHDKKLPGRPDISFPDKKITIFVNGCYWHRCPMCKPSMPKTHIKFWEEKFSNNKVRDKKKLQALKKLRWRSIVVWECEIKKNSLMTASKIKRIIKGK